MASELEKWARSMRQTLQEDIDHLRGGGTYLSASGGDITENRAARMQARLDQVDRILQEIDNPPTV